MTIQWLLLSTALAAFTSGCAISDDIGAVDYEVGGGLAGTGDGTLPLHVEPDGTATQTMPDGDKQTFRLDPLATGSLYRKLEAAQFETLEPVYDTCCDLYVHTVTVEVNGIVRTFVGSDLGPTPQRLKVVFDALNAIDGPTQ